ncbi:MAG: protease modulator HflK [Verrucomicrobia bacterium]|jgi:modulator of FtsH protease HflK|nr:protease modulator HflK [Verrucomicrobiota bacterium]
MTDPKKPDLPDLPEKIEATAGKEPETVQVARPMEDSSTRALSDALSSSFKIIKVLMVGLVVIFLGSGVFTVEPNEVAVVLRFGKPLGSGPDQVLQQGLHWSFPSPIDEIVTVPIGETRNITATNCWYAETPEMQVSGQLPFAMPSLRPGVDGYALTSDGNIIHTKATAQYLISDPVSFAFSFLHVEDLLENALNNSLLFASAQFSAEDALYRNRLAHKEKVRMRFLESIQKAKLGIELQSLDVQTLPPIFVKQAFELVTQTEQSVSQMRNEAEGDASAMLRLAEGKAQAIISEGLTKSNLITSRIRADANVFKKHLPHYESNPEFYRKRLIIEGMGRVLANAQDTWLLPGVEDGSSQELRLQLNREPTLTGEDQPEE